MPQQKIYTVELLKRARLLLGEGLTIKEAAERLRVQGCELGRRLRMEDAHGND